MMMQHMKNTSKTQKHAKLHDERYIFDDCKDAPPVGSARSSDGWDLSLKLGEVTPSEIFTVINDPSVKSGIVGT